MGLEFLLGHDVRRQYAGCFVLSSYVADVSGERGPRTCFLPDTTGVLAGARLVGLGDLLLLASRTRVRNVRVRRCSTGAWLLRLRLSSIAASGPGDRLRLVSAGSLGD